ncbi:type I-F CRISPR-associated protein Csy1 [Pseudomonas sp. TTU2014-080ASC]|uniref:type I-F CRISPR-associated protein Csy1 n=1 Tax=Pseudomonas sp. TTU2014-080ASC TaxID=1729724 RepID=UPI001364AF3B|nr:type I-F CRISPR-associated protein Csy1 [Pseudomonas sp. TTU2014-080ASC]
MRRKEKALAKWEGKTDSAAKNKIKEINDKYQLDLMIEKGAAGSSQIAIATHVAKATHPDLQVKETTNLNINPSKLQQHPDIGSHLLNHSHSLADTTGNGAYVTATYELYLLLDATFDGKKFGEWLKENDQDAIDAFAHTAAEAQDAKELAANCVKLLEDKTSRLASDTKAKQLYWCISGEPADDNGYHLLQPMFASSLTHAVHQDINDARFGEANKLARQAKREGKPHDAPYHDYRDLVVRKLGGTKPQNISQLNSERGGVNYLLASAPPGWDQNRPRHLLFIDSALPRFARYEGVRELLDALVDLLKSNPPANDDTRKKRRAIEQALGESLAAYGASIHAGLEPGWSRDPNCRLPECEQLWLDPLRVELPAHPQHAEADQAFVQAYEWKDWPDQVAHRFGNWLNDLLRSHDLPVGDAEHAHWARQALIDVDWPAARQRRAVVPATSEEVIHG